jgi:hypothetical protein
MKNLLVLLITIISLSAFSQNKHTISGYLVDQESGESLIGANVIWKNKMQGTTTNTYGFYSLTIPEGDAEIEFSYIGFQSVSKNVKLIKDTRLNVELSSSASELAEVVVVGEETVVERTQTSVVEIPIQQIKKIPSFLGEVDVLKTIQLLPGVQSGGEGSSGFYVRGGGPDQNLILLDGVPVYNASHLFGFFSVFNADAIKNVRLTKGGFPARYGGRLSSVLEIDMKEGNMKQIEGEGSIGLISSKLTLQGPIIKDKTSIIVSARRTYIDLLLQPIIQSSNDGNPAGYYFYDLNAKLNHKISDNDRIYLSAYLGKDKFYVSSGTDDQYSDNGELISFSDKVDFGLQWGNVTSALRWNHLFSNKLFSNTTLTYSKYQFDTSFDLDSEFSSPSFSEREITEFSYYSGIEDYGAKIEFDYLPNPNHYVKFGVNYIHHKFFPGTMDLFSSSEINNVTQVNFDTVFDFSIRLNSDESYLFVEDDIKVNDYLKVNVGAHLSNFMTEGTSYFSLQPRFSTRLLLSKDWSLKASYAEMQQNVHLLSSTSAGLPTDIWVPSTDSVPPQFSRQVSASINHNLGSKGLFELTLEGYYKTLNDLITLKEGAQIIGFQDWQQKVDIGGEGRAYGFEVFLQKKKGNTTGWIGYTLSWSERKFENVNFGNWYPYKYDRRHDISIVLSHKFNDRVDIGATWVFGTGNNITLEEATFPEINDQSVNLFNEINYYSSRNNYRMPAYHRLDVGINFHKKRKRSQRTWSFGLYNAYNRKNPYFINIETNSRLVNGSYVDVKQAVQYSLFPVIPSVSYQFKF